MDTTMAAALVGVGGAVLGSLVGGGMAVYASDRAVARQRRAAHVDRVEGQLLALGDDAQVLLRGMRQHNLSLPAYDVTQLHDQMRMIYTLTLRTHKHLAKVLYAWIGDLNEARRNNDDRQVEKILDAIFALSRQWVGADDWLEKKRPDPDKLLRTLTTRPTSAATPAPKGRPPTSEPPTSATPKV